MGGGGAEVWRPKGLEDGVEGGAGGCRGGGVGWRGRGGVDGLRVRFVLVRKH